MVNRSKICHSFVYSHVRHHLRLIPMINWMLLVDVLLKYYDKSSSLLRFILPESSLFYYRQSSCIRDLSVFFIVFFSINISPILVQRINYSFVVQSLHGTNIPSNFNHQPSVEPLDLPSSINYQNISVVHINYTMVNTYMFLSNYPKK